MSLSRGHFLIGLQWGTLKIRSFCSPGGILSKNLWVTPRVDPRHVTKLEANWSTNRKFGKVSEFCHALPCMGK